MHGKQIIDVNSSFAGFIPGIAELNLPFTVTI
jgi:hypothetical protein